MRVISRRICARQRLPEAGRSCENPALIRDPSRSSGSLAAACKLNLLKLSDAMERLQFPGFAWLGAALVVALAFAGCEVERRRSDRELGLNPQQASGRHLYDQHCDRCHAPYSSRKRQGPGLKGVFKRPYLRSSGMPATDDRVADIIRYGRGKMPGYGQILSASDMDALIAYLHTL
jgi:mono/diheme cytochrome c family protein